MGTADSRDARRVRRGCTNREVRKVILAAMAAGARYKMTKHGIIFYGEQGGTECTHFTVSDHRGSKNLKRSLERLGILHRQ